MHRFLLGFFASTTVLFGVLYVMQLGTPGENSLTTNVIEAEQKKPAPVSSSKTLALPETASSEVDVARRVTQNLIDRGQFEEAHNQLERTASDDTDLLYLKATLAAYFGETEEAKNLFTQIITRGDRPERSKDAQNFLNSLEEATLALDAPAHYLTTLLGRSLAETDQPALAIPLLYDVLREAPDYRDAWIILGYAYLTQNKFKEAQDALFKAVALDGTKAETRYFLGMAAFGLDDYTSAVTQFTLSIESGFEPLIQAFQKLGDAAVLSREYQTAADAYSKAILLNQEDLNLFVRPVWLNIDHLNQPQRALELAEQAMTAHPNEAMSHNLMGWALSANGRTGEALKSLNAALTLDPNLAAAHLNLARLYEQTQKRDEALLSYEKARDLDPQGSIGTLAAEHFNRLSQSLTPLP